MTYDDRPRIMLLVALALLTTCFAARANEQGVTYLDGSSRSLMVPLETCMNELSRLEQGYEQSLTLLENDWKARLDEAVKEAAAEAVTPVMDELRLVESQRDRAVAAARAWTVSTVVAGLLGIIATLVATLVSGLPPP